MRSRMAGFTPKAEKLEKSPFSTQNTPTNPSPTIFEPTNNVTEVYASTTTPNDAIFRPPTLSTDASSPQDSELSASPGHEKSVPLHAVFKSQLPTGSPEAIYVDKALKTRLGTAVFVKIRQKIENSPIFTKMTPEPLVSSHSKQTDDIYLLLSPTTIVTASEMRSSIAVFTKIHQKLENSPFFTKIAPEPLVSDCLSIYFLPPPSISPTKHPCNLSGPLVMILFLPFNCHFAVLSPFFSYRLSYSCYCLTFDICFILFSFFDYQFAGNEGVAIFEGGTWSMRLRTLQSSILSYLT